MTKLGKGWLLSLFSTFILACSPSGDQLEREERAPSRTQAAALSQDGQYSLVATSEHGLRLFKLGQREPLHNWQQDDDGTSQIRAVRLAPDSSVAVGASRETIAMWDIESGDVIGFWRISEAGIRDVAVSNGGRHLIMARNDGVVEVFEPNSGRRLEFFGHHESVNRVDVSANGRYVLSGADDHRALLWNTQSGQQLREVKHSGRVSQVRFHPNGSLAFTASGQDAIIWKPSSGERVSQLKLRAQYKNFTSAAFSEDGRYLLTGSPSRDVETWRVSTGERVARLQVTGREGDYPPRAAVIAVAFVGQSGHIVTENSAGFSERWYIGQLFDE